MEKRSFLQDVDWNNAALRMLPGSGSTFAKRLIVLAKQMIKSTPNAKRLKRQAARRRKKKRKDVEFNKTKRKIIGILIAKAESLWRGDLCSMNYSDFLLTPYWKIIREIKLRQSNFSCEKCGCDKRLQTHHKIYDHRGSEHLYLNDLQVLCDLCHKSAHHINIHHHENHHRRIKGY